MPLPLYADLVMETSTSEGTGTITLAGALTGFRTFASIGDGEECVICIRAVDGSGNPTGQWEICKSVYTASGTTLTRGLLRSSSTGSRVDFSAGTKRVYVVQDAAAVGPRDWNFVHDFGADPTGTDDCTALLQNAIDTFCSDGGGHTLYFPPGVYKMSGAMQDTGDINAQVIIPVVSITGPPVSIRFKGHMAPPIISSQNINMGIPAQNYSIIKGTLTGQSGTAKFLGSEGTLTEGFGIQNNVYLHLEDLIFEWPSNPTYTVVDYLNIWPGRIKDVMIHAGEVDIDEMVEPTNSNAYGIALSPNNKCSSHPVDHLQVFGFYVGMRIGELANVDTAIFFSCKIAVEIPEIHHLSTFKVLSAFSCPTVIKGVNGNSKVNIFSLDIENSNETHAPWQDTVYNIDDSNGFIKGKVHAWLVVDGGVGVIHTLIKNGAANLLCYEYGEETPV